MKPVKLWMIVSLSLLALLFGGCSEERHQLVESTAFGIATPAFGLVRDDVHILGLF